MTQSEQRTIEQQAPFWMAELFHPSGNSATVYWSGGSDTHDKIYCAEQFPDSGLCASVCELLNKHPEIMRVGQGMFWRAIEHAWIEGSP
jgi:hypothetical protein